jgi:hypothetical protein
MSSRIVLSWRRIARRGGVGLLGAAILALGLALIGHSEAGAGPTGGNATPTATTLPTSRPTSTATPTATTRATTAPNPETPTVAATARGGATCAVTRDYALGGLRELSAPLGAWLHVEFSRQSGDPERETMLAGGSYTLAQAFPVGHLWEYNADCTANDVRTQIDAHIARRRAQGANNAGFAPADMVAALFMPGLHVTAPPTVTSAASALCPSTPEAQRLVGVSLRQLEEPCGWAWNGTPVEATCPQGWICTLSTDGTFIVTIGDGVRRTIAAGTFRFVAAYPTDDAVHSPCALVEKEHAFAPRLTFVPDGFSCAPVATATATLPAPASRYPLAGTIFRSNKGDGGANDRYRAIVTDAGRIWQDLLPPGNERVAHAVAIQLSPGQYRYRGVACTLYLDPEQNGKGSANTPPIASHLNMAEYDSFTVRTSHTVAWALVECDGGASSGFEIRWLGAVVAAPTAPPASSSFQLGKGEAKRIGAYAVVAGDVKINGSPLYASQQDAGRVVLLTEAADVEAPWGATVTTFTDLAAAKAKQQAAADEMVRLGCAHGCLWVIQVQWPRDATTATPKATSASSSYWESGIGNTAVWTVTLAPGTVTIIAGYRVDDETNGIYKAVRGGGTISTTVQDGFLIAIEGTGAQQEFCARVARAQAMAWAHDHIYPLAEWSACSRST